MENIINISGVIGEIPDESGNPIVPNTTFMSVVQQVEALKDAVVLSFLINSPGGYLEDGDEIYDYIESLKAKGITVNTYAKERCASIATKIFLAGEQRLLVGSPEFMIHNPFGSPEEGDADKIESYYKELRSVENDLIKFYNGKTGTSKEAIKPLMKKETFLTPDQAIQLGFATGVYQPTELKAVAYLKNHNLKRNQMSKEVLTKKEAESMLGKLGDRIKAFLDPKVKNKLIQDATGVELDFTALTDEQTPAVGDLATVDGVAAEGEYLLPSGETYVFAEGALTEIKTAEEEGLEEITDLKVQLESLMQNLLNEKSNVKALKKENKSFKNVLGDLQKEIKSVKKSIGSDFKHDTKKKNLKPQEQGSRKLFKD
tara:strand:+ start:42 stop:1157 length:1116 start_codon:yes stop_codon:yes gene_type:complete